MQTSRGSENKANRENLYILSRKKRCSFQLKLNWTYSTFPNATSLAKTKNLLLRKKITVILIVCRFLVHLHQLSALLRFLRLLSSRLVLALFFSLTTLVALFTFNSHGKSLNVLCALHNVIKFVVFFCPFLSHAIPFFILMMSAMSDVSGRDWMQSIWCECKGFATFFF